MNELAATAAVVAMSIDDDGEADLGLEDAPVATAATGMPMPDLEDSDMEKENEDVLPVLGKFEAEARKVVVRPHTQEDPAKFRPTLSAVSHP